MTDAPCCSNCGRILQPGRGDFYIVRIDAVADPAGPIIDAEELAGDIRGRIEALIAQARSMPEQELLDEVYQRVIVYLCTDCYRRWIRDPTGKGDATPTS